jgi:N-methylhydantoinase A
MTDLGVKKAIIPPAPGLFSAYGLLVSDYKVERSCPYVKEMAEDLFRSLEESALESLKDDVVSDVAVERSVDARYRGQLYELTVPYGKDAENAFHEKFRAIYGYSMREREVEFVNLRLRVVATTYKPPLVIADIAERPAPPRERRQVIFREGTFSAPVYDRRSLTEGSAVAGPAIVESFDSTTILPPSFECIVDGFGNLLVSRL